MKRVVILFFVGFLLLLGNGLYAQSNQKNDAQALNQSAIVHYNNGDYEKAISDFEAALKLDPNNADIKQELERVRKKRGSR